LLDWLLTVLNRREELRERTDGNFMKRLGRYAKGVQIEPEAADEIRKQVAILLADDRLSLTVTRLPDVDAAVGEQHTTTGPVHRPAPADVWDDILRVALDRWDRLRPLLMVLYARVPADWHPAAVIVRVLLPDVAVRIAAIRWCERAMPKARIAPSWAHEEGGSAALLRHLSKTAHPPLTLLDVAQACHVSPSTVQDWRRNEECNGTEQGSTKSNVPSHRDIQELAKLLAPRCGIAAPSNLAVRLHRHYTLVRIRRSVNAVMGGNAVVRHYAARIEILVERCLDYWNRPATPFDVAENIERNARMGLSPHTADRKLLDAISDSSDHIEACRDMTAWKAYVSQVGHREDAIAVRLMDSLSSLSDAALNPDIASNPLARELVQSSVVSGLPPAPTVEAYEQECLKRDQEAMRAWPVAAQIGFKHDRTTEELYALGRFGLAVQSAQRAYEACPDNAEYARKYALLIAETGDQVGALLLLHTASRLSPTWSTPHEEIGQFLIELGRPEDALRHFLSDSPLNDAARTNRWYLMGQAAQQVAARANTPAKQRRTRQEALAYLKRCIEGCGDIPHVEMPRIFLDAMRLALELKLKRQANEYRNAARAWGALPPA
jgi:tetratricopeptide (TPR) repeat protein